MRPVAALWALGAGLVVVHLIRPTGTVGDTTYLIAVWVGAAAGWYGTVTTPRKNRRMGVAIRALIAGGLTASAIGDALWLLYTWSGRDPDVAIPDIFYFLSYLGLGAAVVLILLMRLGRSPRTNVETAIDSLTVVAVSVLVFWTLSIQSIVADSSASPATRFVWATYPVFDAVLLALVLRALFNYRTRRIIGVGLPVGVACWLVSDVGYLVLDVSGTASAVLDAGWMFGAVVMGATTLRPPTAVIPERPEAHRVPLGRLGVAIVPLLVPPVLLLVNHLAGRPVHVIEAVVGMGVLVAIAFVRTARMLQWEADARRELAIARDTALEASRARPLP